MLASFIKECMIFLSNLALKLIARTSYFPSISIVKLRFFLLAVLFTVSFTLTGAGEAEIVRDFEKPDSIYCSDEIQLAIKNQGPNPILKLIKKKRDHNKRVTAAVLAFPFPFGIVGLHRIYMGTAPHVPVVYIATAGGIFGILPFIDFCLLVLDKDIDRFIENKKVFMWVN